jgi:hypothetical protein
MRFRKAVLSLAVLLLASVPLVLSQTLTVLHRFSGTGGDGANPYAGLTLDSAGNLYGTTSYGGDLTCRRPD